MTIEVVYFLVLFAVVIVWYIPLKRPLYEGLFIGFVVLLFMTGEVANAPEYIIGGLKSSTMYVIIAFLLLSEILTATGVIDDLIYIILALVGRIRGGAGYVAIISSAFMGSLSGSGPGNVATTGVFTIPAMKRSGFPPHLAATIEMSASVMGNMIPPSGTIAIAFGCLEVLYPGEYSIGEFWILLWIISMYFIVARIVALYFMCKYYKLDRLDESEIPNLKESFRKGWKGLLFPVFVFMPFMFDVIFNDFVVSRLGDAGASAYSSSILLFVPCFVSVFALIVTENKSARKYDNLIKFFNNTLVKFIPICAVTLVSYFISNLLNGINAAEAIRELITGMDIGYVGLAFIVPIITTILGMLLPGSSQTTIFGPTIISIMTLAGCNPMLAAAMLPNICTAMCGMTPPVAIAMYTAMGIANSGMKETSMSALFWVALQYALTVPIFLGLLPMGI